MDKVREATKIAKARRPDLKIEGPIQYDAAIDQTVAKVKMPGSEVAGHATVFIFPDLSSGNNAYKAVQRAANATAIGPVLVTPDEIGDPYALKMTASVNGERWSEGNSGSITHRFEQMIAFASMEETLYPGDLIGSGTVGTGCGLSPCPIVCNCQFRRSPTVAIGGLPGVENVVFPSGRS